MTQWGKYIIVAGLVVVAIGLVVYFFGDKLTWLGRLPGDIRIKNENTRFYFPITTMILVSVVLTLLMNLLRRWW